jgi:hypothetical protein
MGTTQRLSEESIHAFKQNISLFPSHHFPHKYILDVTALQLFNYNTPDLS